MELFVLNDLVHEYGEDGESGVLGVYTSLQRAQDAGGKWVQTYFPGSTFEWYVCPSINRRNVWSGDPNPGSERWHEGPYYLSIERFDLGTDPLKK